MHSDGGMDHLGEAAGSRGAAALHHDREVRAPSRPAAGPVGRPRAAPLPSRPNPNSPQPILYPLAIVLCPRVCVPSTKGLPDPSDALLPSCPRSALHPFPVEHRRGFTILP